MPASLRHASATGRAQGEMLHEYRKPQNSVPVTGMRRNPICRRFFSGSALGAKFEVVVRVASAIEVTLRHHRVAFPAKMFVNHRPSQIEIRSTILRVTRRRRRS